MIRNLSIAGIVLAIAILAIVFVVGVSDPVLYSRAAIVILGATQAIALVLGLMMRSNEKTSGLGVLVYPIAGLVLFVVLLFLAWGSGLDTDTAPQIETDTTGSSN